MEAAEKQQRETSNRLEEQRRTAEEKGASTAQLLKETQDELKQVEDRNRHSLCQSPPVWCRNVGSRVFV